MICESVLRGLGRAADGMPGMPLMAVREGSTLQGKPIDIVAKFEGVVF